MNYFGQYNRLPPEQKEKVQTTDKPDDFRVGWTSLVLCGGTVDYSWEWLFYYCTQAENFKHF